jgi:HEAT repeat protein/Tfp pilus assembly protein PilF
MRVFDLLKSRIDKMEEKRDINGLILALKDDDEIIRKESARALGNLGAVEATESLTNALEDPHQGVREETITALGKIGNKQATNTLIKALSDPQISVRWRAAQALGNIGSPEAVKPLTQTLQDQDTGVREEVITALGKIGTSEAIEPLLKSLKSPHITIRWRAVHALGMIADPRATESLTETLQDQDPGVREESITALGRITIKPYLKNLENTDSRVKAEAIQNIQLPDEKQIINTELDTIKTVPEEDEAIVSDISTSSDGDVQLKQDELKNKGYYHYIERFIDKSRYDYQENMIQKTGYSYQISDLSNLRKLVEYKGVNIEEMELQEIIQIEIKNQEFREFEEKIMEYKPTNKMKFLEIYAQNYTSDTPETLQYLEKLLKSHNKPVQNLKAEVLEIRQKKEMKEFENKLLQPSIEGSATGKGSPSILLKFIKKELIEKRDKLISTSNYHLIESFVHTAKYDYQIQDLEKLKKLLETKNLSFQDEELLWLIQEEIKSQEYQEFEEKIMENQPTSKQNYLEQYIKNYPQNTSSSIGNLRKLMQKQKISSINLEKELEEVREKKEVEEFEKRLFHDEDSPYESLPVIESGVAKDRALKNSQILSNLGNLFYDLGKTDEALNYYDKALSTYPEYITAWKNKGLIFLAMGRPQKAANCFYQVLNLDPEFGEVWLDIGMILFEMGQVEEAKLCYEKALHIQPGNLAEISSYTRKFLHKNPYYLEMFEKYLKTVSSDELALETEDAVMVDKFLKLLRQ